MTNHGRPADAMAELTAEEMGQVHGGAQFSVQLYFGTPHVRTADEAEPVPYQGKLSGGGYVPT